MSARRRDDDQADLHWLPPFPYPPLLPYAGLSWYPVVFCAITNVAESNSKLMLLTYNCQVHVSDEPFD
jgi:hypothetical protein